MKFCQSYVEVLKFCQGMSKLGSFAIIMPNILSYAKNISFLFN
jgi:hypothetical protein